MGKKTAKNTLPRILEKIDKLKTLSIHNLINNSDDPVVKEYCDKLVKVNFFPTLPKDEDVKTFPEILLKTSLSKECKSSCVDWLMSYFQSCYFKNNIMNARENDVAIIPVFSKIFMPCFTLLPDFYLQQFTKLKRALSVHLGTASVEGTNFIKELLVIRAINCIRDEVLPQAENNTNLKTAAALQSEIQKHFNVIYIRTEMEFYAKFPLKCID